MFQKTYESFTTHIDELFVPCFMCILLGFFESDFLAEIIVRDYTVSTVNNIFHQGLHPAFTFR